MRNVLEDVQYLQVMLLMELSKNIHDGHGPGVLRSEDLQQWREQRKEWMRMAVSFVLEVAEHSKCFTYSHTNSNRTSYN